MFNQLPKVFAVFVILFVAFFGSSTSYRYHSVKKGETLYGISKTYNVSITTICKTNNLSSGTSIKYGDKLKIPVKNITKYKYHYVSDGENLFRIGLKYNITVTKLCKLNNLKENVQLKKGMKLKVPDFDDEEQSVAKADKSYKLHYMEKGETLWGVSRNYNVSLQSLYKINNITKATQLKEGDKIKIPQTQGYLNFRLPLLGKVKPFIKSHYRGLLIFADKDSNSIYASNDGTITHVDNRAGYGIIVFIKHDNGYLSTYSGFKELYVKKGDKVKSNQLIGKAGKVSRYKKDGILYSLQHPEYNVKFDYAMKKFYK